jgi:hypothetical protein
MGGPCKALSKGIKVVVDRDQNPCGAYAKPRHRGPSLEEGNLTARQVAYDKLHDKAPYHRPGSLNGHKS